MLLAISLFVLGVVQSITGHASSPQPGEPGQASSRTKLKHANDIFNTIHSSMRLWGSALNHNGMSFFPAMIPAGTQLYHGRQDVELATGMDWLAFDPSFAYVFTGRIPLPRKDDNDHRFVTSGRAATLDSKGPGLKTETTKDPSQQRPLDQVRSLQSDVIIPGFLHTFIAKHDLNVLYVDGLSAAKTGDGTLDSQDELLRNNKSQEISMAEKFNLNDWIRATDMCRLAREDWQGRIDGFIRMSLGPELILCDFEKHLDLSSVVRAQETLLDGADQRAFAATYDFVQAATTRYSSVGNERVSVDYERIVTAYAYDVDLFLNTTDGRAMPRLLDVPSSTRERILSNLTRLILQPSSSSSSSSSSSQVDWQSAADNIIARYSDRLYTLNHTPFTSKSDLDFETTLLMRPFIDFTSRDPAAENRRCSQAYIPPDYNPSLAADAIVSISTLICSTLTSILDEPSLETATATLQDLVSYLQWTTWKECRPGCNFDEVCFVPIWPLGGLEDHEKPNCKGREDVGKTWGGGYWHPGS